MNYHGGGKNETGTHFSDDEIEEIHRRSLAFLEEGIVHGKALARSERLKLIAEVQSDLDNGESRARA